MIKNLSNRGSKGDISNPLGIEPLQIKPVRPEGKNVIRKFAFATRGGFHPTNREKVNQDAYILQPNVQGLSQVHLFGVCDGHGHYGRNVSHFVKSALFQEIEKNY